MRSAAILALAGVLLVAGASSSATSVAAATPRCAPGSLRVVVGSAARCLTLEVRVRIRDRFLQMRNAAAVGRMFHVTPAIVRAVSRAPTSQIVAGSGAAVAQDLASAPHCTTSAPPRAVADLSWSPARAGALEQRIAVSIHDGGFREGLFISSAPLMPERNSFTWTQMRGQANHAWVVLTLSRDGWVMGPPGTFVGPLCPIDYQR